MARNVKPGPALDKQATGVPNFANYGDSGRCTKNGCTRNSRHRYNSPSYWGNWRSHFNPRRSHHLLNSSNNRLLLYNNCLWLLCNNLLWLLCNNGRRHVIHRKEKKYAVNPPVLSFFFWGGGASVTIKKTQIKPLPLFLI